MKVSVIIPVYNVSAYIERCIRSVLDQTWQALEVIVVDDCGNDNSMEVAGRVVQSHPRSAAVKFLGHERNRGLSAARNTGVAAASGEYVYFLDSDDYLPPDAIEQLARAAERERPDFVIGNFTIEGSGHSAPALRLPSGTLTGNDAILSSYVRKLWYVMACNKLTRRSFLTSQNITFYERMLHEDDPWTFQLACTAQKMTVVDRVTYVYYIHPGSITTALSRRNLEARVLTISLFYDYITASQERMNNRWIYLFFEHNKVLFFDFILYHDPENAFHYQSYQLFRQKSYIRPCKAIRRFHPGFKQAVLGLHYYLPLPLGYAYFKGIGLLKWVYYNRIRPALSRNTDASA
ncbi:MAG: glycosyltransferase [Prevotellaceae bacterium]|jgi:glycosyltransferase involved in cell wall biosynthesis|nr:glycosyltransferase [Prevotellaceae bacterium]